jgi:hypothetical protein
MAFEMMVRESKLAREAVIIREQAEWCWVVALVEARMAREKEQRPAVTVVKLDPMDRIDLSED